MIFTGISMLIARMTSVYGDAAVVVQKVGSQIESISWMTADGFAAAVCNQHRIWFLAFLRKE